MDSEYLVQAKYLEKHCRYSGSGNDYKMSKILVDEAVLEEAIQALRHGIAQLNYMNISLEAVPLHQAIIAIKASLEDQNNNESELLLVTAQRDWALKQLMARP